MPTRAMLAVVVFVAATGTMPAQSRPRSAAASMPQATALKPIGSVKELMQAITVPTSEAVFKAASEAPTKDAEWVDLRHQALALAESSNLLLMAGRAPDRDAAWTTFAVAQRDAAIVAMKAAAAKDGDALSTASDTLYETCASCHKQYMPAK